MLIIVTNERNKQSIINTILEDSKLIENIKCIDKKDEYNKIFNIAIDFLQNYKIKNHKHICVDKCKVTISNFDTDNDFTQYRLV